MSMNRVPFNAPLAAALRGIDAPFSPPGKRWRVLLVITSSDMGGAEHIVRELAARLDRNLFEPHVCSLRPAGQMAAAIAAHGTPVRSLEMSEQARPAELIGAARQLARWIDEDHVDLVHSFLYRGNIVARFAARLAKRRPVVVSGQHSLGPLGGRHVVLASRLTRHLSDRIVAVSNAVRDAALRIEGGRPERIAVIPNGVEPERYAGYGGSRLHRQLGLDRDAFIVGAVGRLAAEKGIGTLIEAVAEARQQGVPAELLLAGAGPEREGLGQQSRSLGIAERVHFLGMMADPRPVYASLDVFALPSLEEASPTSLMEAMASGCAIVAASVGGVPEIVEHGCSALLVPPRSASSLTASLIRLSADPMLRKRLGAEARRRVQTAFTLERMVERHADLYRQLLEDCEMHRG